MKRIVTLMTDFGTSDPYAASMKGVIYGICPEALVVDASHTIPPQDVRAASWFVAASAPYFPEGSVHVIVVDPGVGTDRLPLAVSAGGRFFVCPDNGVLTLYLRWFPLTAARSIANPLCVRDSISSTFHGRDIFAPTGAQLACGMDIDDVGPPVERMVALDLPEPRTDPSGVIHGEIIHIDRFGNLISNIPHALWGLEDGKAAIRAADRFIEGISQSYGSRRRANVLAVWGSTGFLEIAVNQGNAAQHLALGVGSGILLFDRCKPPSKPSGEP
jgi:S-adenosylmethionine hydrolase